MFDQFMDLVLFTDALQHLLRISRLLSMPRGNALLVGVGGSGRQSLTRLAAYLARHVVFQIALTRTYKTADFLEDIKKMYVMVGKEGKKVTWVFTDFEIINEIFLEYINAILATGEVAGLFPKDERDIMCADLRGPAKKDDPTFDDTPDNLYKYFINRIRDNLHVRAAVVVVVVRPACAHAVGVLQIVLCFSPANEKFAERARRFPGLISGCTIDWFLRWPEEALVDVATKFVVNDKDFKVLGRASVHACVQVCACDPSAEMVCVCSWTARQRWPPRWFDTSRRCTIAWWVRVTSTSSATVVKSTSRPSPTSLSFSPTRRCMRASTAKCRSWRTTCGRV